MSAEALAKADGGPVLALLKKRIFVIIIERIRRTKMEGK
jgi:hypothetical protein